MVLGLEWPFWARSKSLTCGVCNNSRRTMDSPMCMTLQVGLLVVRKVLCISEPAIMSVLKLLTMKNGNLFTLMCNHFAYPANYATIFAPSCGSIGAFTDVKQLEDGTLAITPQMQSFSFPVRRLTGEFYAHVYPFDPKFYRKVHPSGALLFSGVHSHLTLLQHLCIHCPIARRPIYTLSEVPTYWHEDDGTL